MADKKFSDFQNEAFDANTELVGFKQGDTTNNYRYDKTQLQTGILTGANNSILNNDAGYLATVDLQSNVGTTILPIANGGTGNNSISDLQNISVNYASDGTGILPITKGGTGYDNSYKSVQVFVWTNGGPVGYNNVPNSVPTKIPFDPAALVSTIEPSGLANAQWVCANSGAGFPGMFATFTLGASGGGLWKVRVAQHWLDQTNQVEIRGSFVLGGSTAVTIDVIDEKSTELTGDKIFYGELIQEFAGGDTLELELEFIGGGVNPYPSASGNRPPEISFERLI